MRLVWVDCWTSFGGSQFLDSPGTGQYHSYLCDEIVPFVDARYRTLDAPEHRGIAGKSSGGYGAMVTPMLRPDLFGGMATHAGDALFETCYIPFCARRCASCATTTTDRSSASSRTSARRPALSKNGDMSVLNDWCMAACYSADQDGTVHLPYDTDTGELIPEVWERWLAWDPVRMVRGPRRRAARHDARSTSTPASRDQFYLDLGAEAFRRELAAIGVTDVDFDLFDATHSRSSTATRGR